MNFHLLKIKEKQQETQDTLSLIFDVPSNLTEVFQYTQGQYLTLKFDIDGKEERRAYSMSSSPVEKDLKITIKRVERGIVSNYIHDKLHVGDTIEVMKPQGRFFTPLDITHRKTYYLFGAGSGITPLMSILKTILEKEPQSSVFLLYGSRDEDNIIFKNELDTLEQKYKGQFALQYTLSQPKIQKPSGFGAFLKKGKISWTGLQGRIDDKKVNQFLIENPIRYQDVECFVCGPTGMNDSIKNILQKKTIDSKNIHIEYFTASKDKSTTENTPVNTPSNNAMVKIHLDEKTIDVEVPKDKTILDILLNLKHDVPYSCTSGSCSTCMAKLIKGKVQMDICYALDDDEIEEGYILTCQAKPTTDLIELTFDV